MTKIVLAAVLLTAITSVAFAQSHDPSVGSGNIVQSTTQLTNQMTNQLTKWQGPLRAYAQERPSPQGVQPFTAAEKALFDRIPIE